MGWLTNGKNRTLGNCGRDAPHQLIGSIFLLGDDFVEFFLCQRTVDQIEETVFIYPNLLGHLARADDRRYPLLLHRGLS